MVQPKFFLFFAHLELERQGCSWVSHFAPSSELRRALRKSRFPAVKQAGPPSVTLTKALNVVGTHVLPEDSWEAPVTTHGARKDPRKDPRKATPLESGPSVWCRFTFKQTHMIRMEKLLPSPQP